MTKTVSATEARVHFGELLRGVTERGDTYLVERSGTPLAVKPLQLRSRRRRAGGVALRLGRSGWRLRLTTIPAERSTRITITSGAALAALPSPATAGRLAFQYAALAETAVIPVREQEVQTYFSSRLPAKLVVPPEGATLDTTRKHQENFGRLLATYLIPDDFRRLMQTVTLRKP